MTRACSSPPRPAARPSSCPTNGSAEGLQKLIRFEERAELLGTPRALFSAGQYNEAAEAYGKVARDYAIILSGPQNFASEALFYQIESLKRAGQYCRPRSARELPAAVTITTKLTEAYKRPFEFQKLWAFLGQNDFAGLKAAIEPYQEPRRVTRSSSSRRIS